MVAKIIISLGGIHLQTTSYQGLSYYVIIDMNNKIILETMNKIEAEEKFVQLKDSTPNVHIILAEVRKEFVRENGNETLNKFV